MNTSSRLQAASPGTPKPTRSERCNDWNGWNTFDLVVYTDESVTNGTGTGSDEIVVTTDHPSDPQNLRSFAIPTGKWCSFYQTEIKAVVEALQVIQAEEHAQKD